MAARTGYVRHAFQLTLLAQPTAGAVNQNEDSSDSCWMTYKQARAEGAQVRKD